jgi:hypothetical protein
METCSSILFKYVPIKNVHTSCLDELCKLAMFSRCHLGYAAKSLDIDYNGASIL